MTFSKTGKWNKVALWWSDVGSSFISSWGAHKRGLVTRTDYASVLEGTFMCLLWTRAMQMGLVFAWD